MSTWARPALLLGLLAIVAMAGLVLVGWRGPQTMTPVLGLPHLPVLLPVTTACGGMAAVLLSVAARSSGRGLRIAYGAIAATLCLWAMDGLPQWPIRLILVILAVGLVITGFLAATWLDQLSLRHWLVGIPFAAAVLATSLRSGPETDLAALRAAQLGTVSALLVAALGAFALVTTLVARHERAGHAIEGRAPTWVLVVALLVKGLLIAALYLHLTGDWLGGAPYWSLRLGSPLSWLHAALIAGVVLWVAIRSWARPIPASGFTAGAGVLAAGAAGVYLIAAAAGVAVTIGSTLSPGADFTAVLLAATALVDLQPVLDAAFAVAILIAALCGVLFRSAWSTGWYFLLIAGLWLVPPLTGIALDAASVRLTPFWATPGQVDTLVTVGVAGYAVRAAATGRLDKQVTMLVRLLVLFWIVVHLSVLLPASWAQALPTWGVAISAVVAITLDGPAVSPDPRTNDRALSRMLAAQLGLLATAWYLLPNAELSGQLDTASTSAWLWMAVPVSAVLVARTRRRHRSPGNSVEASAR